MGEAVWMGLSVELSPASNNTPVSPEQRSRHFADDILKGIFLKEILFIILIQISLKRHYIGIALKRLSAADTRQQRSGYPDQGDTLSELYGSWFHMSQF